MFLSGVSIYWSSPIYQHKPDPVTGSFDVAAEIGIWICAHVPGQHHYTNPPDWLYNHVSLGPGILAPALLVPHHGGQPLTVEHGVPLRLLVPVKLGLKNVKAITRITYSAKQPRDYWEPYGYSSYDGI